MKNVKVDDWNLMQVEANGAAHQEAWINGKLCVDLKDEFISRQRS